MWSAAKSILPGKNKDSHANGNGYQAGTEKAKGANGGNGHARAGGPHELKKLASNIDLESEEDLKDF